MHACPECGKTLATAGGLEVHMELAHRAEASEPEPAESERTELTWSARVAMQLVDDHDVADPTVPFAVVLVVLLFVGSVAALVAG